MSAHLLPVKHYHVIFTLPHELNDLVFYNQQVMYNLLFRSAWESIKKIVGSGMTGMVATLHSWGSNLSFHPHLHCIVPAGKLLNDKWRQINGSTQRCYCNAKELRHSFRQVFMKNLTAILENEELYVEKILVKKPFAHLQSLLKTIATKKWNIRIESPLVGTQQIIEYLGRYVRRVAVTNNRIEEVTSTHVRLKYKQYVLQEAGKPAPEATIKFDGVTFLQRFTQHILPLGFHRVRYYGLYSWAAKRKKAKAYTLLEGRPPGSYERPLKRTLLKKILGTDPDVCPDCGAYQTLDCIPQQETRKYYFVLKKDWHNIRVKLRQDVEELVFESPLELLAYSEQF